MISRDERQITITNGDLRLEAAVHDGEGAIAAVVLHPHPQYGGDMDNHVGMAITSALAARGATTIRFNFRGTGASTGTYDGGDGEASDARAAVAAAREAAPEAKLILAGYSFGAMIAAAIAADVAPYGFGSGGRCLDSASITDPRSQLQRMSQRLRDGR